MQAAIISVGTELATGQVVDTNAAWLAGELTRRGVQVVEHITVADDVERLANVIHRTLHEAAIEFMVVTGGLGPTKDDVTREAIAAAIGQPLEENAEALAQVQDFFKRLRRRMSAVDRVQAMIPRGATILPNRRGTAPGIGWIRDNGYLFALPGVPSEMKAMFVESVLPLLEGVTDKTRTLEARLHCFGIGEAELGERLADLMTRDRNPLIGTTASGAVVTVRILATACDEAEAESKLAADVAEVRRRLGSTVFGDAEDRLQEATARLLVREDKTVAVAESCTGGLLAGSLTDVPGSSAYFLRGYVAYADQAKTDLLGVPEAMIASEGAVSEAVARAMAVGCRDASGADLALSITGIAGPGGGAPPAKPVGLVYIGLVDSTGVQVKRFLLGEHLSRDQVRDRSCKAALNLLRLRLLEGGAA